MTTQPMNARVLVLDDDADMTELIAEHLADRGLEVVAHHAADPALEAFAASDFDVLISDLRMPDRDGFEVLAAARATAPHTPVILMTAFATVDQAVEAMQKGAFNYLTKPFALSELDAIVDRALEVRALDRENRRLKALLDERPTSGPLLGESDAMRRLRNAIGRVAQTRLSILVRGPTGAGKELVARAVHLASPRASRAFVALNCAALPAELLESELFGHTRGAYSGATTARRGLLVESDGGTLFLDEIGDMDLRLQAKLLRVLEDGEVRPVGSDTSRKVDVRVVAATHRDLEQRVARGEFREDLHFRLAVVPLDVPPLRERTEDLPLLIEHFARECAREVPGLERLRVTPEALALLSSWSWPGNVRELANFVKRAAITVEGGLLDVADVRTLLPASSAPAAAAPAALPAWVPREVVPLQELEGAYIDHVIEVCGGNKTEAARLLGIDVSTIHRRRRRGA